MSQTVSLEKVKELRAATGVGMSKCKEALVESDGDIQKAIEYLRKAGMASAVKKKEEKPMKGNQPFLKQTSA
jgi:elongation factor Ts